MSNIEKLYYNLCLMNEHADMPETIEAGDRLEGAMGKELYGKYEDEIIDCTAANEKQGFIFGFQYAVSLLVNGESVSVNE